MTSLQADRLKEFDNELKKRGRDAVLDWRESKNSVSRGVLFADVNGVTLMLYPNGLISVPCVRTYHSPKYPTPVVAAASANELWDRQKARDDRNPVLAQSRRTGHLGPIVDADLQCGNTLCPCHRQGPEDRQQRAQGGFNTDPNRCS
jgi:hypothetical protein